MDADDAVDTSCGDQVADLRELLFGKSPIFRIILRRPKIADITEPKKG